jgi:iron complex transport system permease protein
LSGAVGSAERTGSAELLSPHRRGRSAVFLAAGVVGVAGLGLVSLFVGVSDIPLSAVLPWSDLEDERETLLISRLPRTLAVVLAGTAMAVSGLVMQMLARNKFVEPSTVGTVESASLGILTVTVLVPGAGLMTKMVVASVFALAGTALFLRILRAVPLRSTLVVPLVGIMLGGVIGAVTTFFAYRLDLLQTLNTWMTGDFSGILAGRYELLWIVAVLTVLCYVAADRFTVVGLGQDFTTNLGLGYRAVVRLGLILVSVVSAVVVVTVGAIPFLGLVVPNVVSIFLGDNVRRAIPWVAVLGAGFVLACDIVGRVVRFPYEIPIGVVVGTVGAALFLYLLLRRGAHVA